MKMKFGSLAKTRFIWHLMAVATILLALVFGMLLPKGTNTASADGLVVTRQLPVVVSRGQTFNVTITFTAPVDNFGLIGVVDEAPTGWGVAVDVTWCIPNASDVTPDKVEYIWYGLYNAGTQFTVVYKVTVPPGASPGVHTFANGDVGYNIGGGKTIHVGIGGQSQVEVKVLAATTVSATDITTNATTLNGNLDSLGVYDTINVSFKWGTVSGALDHETSVQPKTSTDPFNASLNSLTSNTTYYFQAKATADSVTAYGDELSFTTEKLPPIVTTYSATDITTSTANLHGNLASLGDYTPVSVSFKWGITSGALDHETSAQPQTSAPVDFSAALGDLTSNRTYCFRAKAAAKDITVYGDEVSFTTAKVLPKVTASDATDITTSAATLNGNLAGLGDYTPVSVSFEWGTSSGALDHETSAQPQTSTPVDFSAALGDLTSNTRYYFKAKAVADGVTVYGDQLSFTTAKEPPAVTTSGANEITNSAANLHGNLAGLGDYTPVSVSFEWGTTSGALDHETSAQPQTSAPVDFSAALGDLTSNTRYYFRAKATANGITIYGDQLSFTTEKVPPTVTTSSVADITTSAATLNGNLASLGDYTTVNVSFEWGTTSGVLDHETSAQPQTSAPADFSATLGDLTSNTRYYFKAKATADDVTVYGDELSFATINVIRHLPATVPRGKTFEVTITFTAPTNEFGQIGVVDEAPADWAVAVDKTRCTPKASDVIIHPETADKAEYVWFDSYDAGTPFTVVYQVTVPPDAPLEHYTFADGQVGFNIAGGATCVADISGDTQTEVIPGSWLTGKTYEANGTVLPYANIGLIKDDVITATAVSDSEGNYTILATQTGNYTLRASKSGFRDESHQISVAVLGQEYTLSFQGKRGIIPNAPDIWYVLDCASLWKYPPEDPGLSLDVWKVLDVAAAWKYPIH